MLQGGQYSEGRLVGDTRKTLAQNPRANEMYQAQARNFSPNNPMYRPENIKMSNVVQTDISNPKSSWTRWDADTRGNQLLGYSAEDIMTWRNDMNRGQQKQQQVNEFQQAIVSNLTAKQNAYKAKEQKIKNLVYAVPQKFW